MAYNRSIKTPSILAPAYITYRKDKRIIIPQSIERPLEVTEKDLTNREKMTPPRYWMTFHRKDSRNMVDKNNPEEKRAVPSTEVRGSLPERIVYKYLTYNMRMNAGWDFDFQSSMNGGRMDLGGMVADFLFPQFKMILQVQGPTHLDYLRNKKDEEQTGILEEMGYKVYFIDDVTIYDVYRFENAMRQIFGLKPGAGLQSSSFGLHNWANDEDFNNEETMLPLLDIARHINHELDIYATISSGGFF